MRERFDLPGELTIYSVTDTCYAMRAWLARQEAGDAEPVEVGAAGVRDIDGAGLQLLGSFTRSLSVQGLAWRFADSSPQLLEACTALGVSSWLTSTGANP